MNRRGFLKRMLHGAALGAAACLAPSIAKDSGDEKLRALKRRQAEMRRARDQFERMNEEFARTFFYGNDAAAARDFVGLTPRYSDRSAPCARIEEKRADELVQRLATRHDLF